MIALKTSLAFSILAILPVTVLLQEEALASHVEYSNNVEEDAKLLVPELIRKYGYPVERHSITTEDGYILELQRIPYGKSGPSKNRPVVYLQHGLLASSAEWVVPGPASGFAYMLVDAGYDVWMANARGTRYSRRHVALDPIKDAKEFWNFSWHEIGIYDVPAAIDHILKVTHQKNLFYIGHSQGTTVSYVLLAERPEYNDKIRALFSLAPTAYMRWMTSPFFRLIAPFQWPLGVMADLLGIHEFAPHTSLLSSVGGSLCGDESILQPLCVNSMFVVCGFNRKQLNTTLIPAMIGHTPAGASTAQILHYAQEINSGKFRQYDYGFFKNKKIYGSMRPPKYQLKNIKAPVYLYYSRNDWLTNEKDVIRLYKRLPNVQARFLVPDNRFNHIDFLYGIDAPQLIYTRVIALMRRH